MVGLTEIVGQLNVIRSNPYWAKGIKQITYDDFIDLKLNQGPEMMSQVTLSGWRITNPVWTRLAMKIVCLESILSIKSRIVINKNYLQKETEIHAG